jgi:hypothetical protein
MLMLFLGALLMPDTGSTASNVIRVVEEQDGRWLGVSVLFAAASIGMLLGLPSLLVLFPSRGRRTGLSAVAVLAVAGAGTAGYAMVLVFVRALVLAEAVRPNPFADVPGDLGLAGFLGAWVGSFYLGELLLAVALLRARSTPRWVPAALLAHVALLPVSSFLPAAVEDYSVVLVVIGFAGTAIAANRVADRTASTVATQSRPGDLYA